MFFFCWCGCFFLSHFFSPIKMLCDRAAHVHIFGGFSSIYLNDMKEEGSESSAGGVVALSEGEGADGVEGVEGVEGVFACKRK